MKNDDLVIPIRTRGSIRVRQDDGTHSPPFTPIRTRGAIRSGVPAERKPSVKQWTAVGFLESLREESARLPLTVLVYGWASDPAREFLDDLLPHLGTEDAIWLVPGKSDSATVVPNHENVVPLKSEQPSHQRTLKNLIGDIVFLSALDSEEVPEVDGWKGAARAVIVKDGAPQAVAILAAARSAGLFGYRWTTDSIVED